MTKAPKEQPSTLKVWSEATARDIVTELERLSLHYPRTDMDARKWAMLFATFHEDLKGVSNEQLRDGCRRYRNDPSNRFFPTPGQLKEACRNPYENETGRRHDPLPELPEIGQCVTPERMRKTMRDLGFTPNSDQHARSIEEHKQAILARPPMPYVETPPELKAERADNLRRRLSAVDHYGRVE